MAFKKEMKKKIKFSSKIGEKRIQSLNSIEKVDGIKIRILKCRTMNKVQVQACDHLLFSRIRFIYFIG